MANFTINGFDDIDKLFHDLSNNVDGIAIEAVNEAAPILENSLRSAISTAASKGYSAGELAASVGILPAKKNEYGVFSVVKPIGDHKTKNPDEKMTNAKLASILEYGRRGGYEKNGRKVTTQAPSPVRAKAMNMVKSKGEEIMRKVVEERMGCE